MKTINERVLTIFLDIDGVLNTMEDWSKPFRLRDSSLLYFSNFLKDVKRRYGRARIIFTSTWRAGFNKVLGHTKPIQRIVDMAEKAGCRVLGATGYREDSDRSLEVMEFIVKHGLEPDSCLIIDDDKAVFKSELPTKSRIYFTNAAVGFTDEDGRKILSSLLK